MKSTTTTCDRCGDCILEGGTVIDVQAGALRSRLHQPCDLCRDCAQLFTDWLSQPRQASQDGIGEALSQTAVASMQLAGAIV